MRHFKSNVSHLNFIRPPILQKLCTGHNLKPFPRGSEGGVVSKLETCLYVLRTILIKMDISQFQTDVFNTKSDSQEGVGLEALRHF